MKDLGVDLGPIGSDTNLQFAVPHQGATSTHQKALEGWKDRKEGLEDVPGGLEERLPGTVRDAPRRAVGSGETVSCLSHADIPHRVRTKASYLYPRGLTLTDAIRKLQTLQQISD